MAVFVVWFPFPVEGREVAFEVRGLLRAKGCGYKLHPGDMVSRNCWFRLGLKGVAFWQEVRS